MWREEDREGWPWHSCTCTTERAARRICFVEANTRRQCPPYAALNSAVSCAAMSEAGLEGEPVSWDDRLSFCHRGTDAMQSQ
jgi:hypothetical protein